MKKFITALATTTILAASPAFADNHMEGSDDTSETMKTDVDNETSTEATSEVDTAPAPTAFPAETIVDPETEAETSADVEMTTESNMEQTESPTPPTTTSTTRTTTRTYTSDDTAAMDTKTMNDTNTSDMTQADTTTTTTENVETTEAETEDFVRTSTTSVPSNELGSSMAVQLFLSIDGDGNGMISQSEWSDWQNRSNVGDDLFGKYDADSDGDIELSEYLMTYDAS